jgi:radical SAM-linked protein
VRTWLVTFSRSGPARYLSHLDTLRALQRTFARAGVQLALSEGMRPRPRLSLPLPLPVGAAALAETAVAEVADGAPGSDEGLRILRAAAPCGLEPTALREVAARLRLRPAVARYECLLHGDVAAIARAAAAMSGAASLPVERRGPRGAKTVDLRESVSALRAEPGAGGARLEFEVRYDRGTAARPQEIIESIATAATAEPVMRRLRRVAVAFHGLPRTDGVRG